MRPDFYNLNNFDYHKDLYSFMLGDEIYVAPVIEKGAKSRIVHLPKGEWKNLINKQEYEGGKTYTVEAPIGTPLAFYLVNGRFTTLFEKIKL